MLLFPATAPLSSASCVRLRYLVDLRIIHHLIIWLVHQATTSSIQIIATIIILHHKFIALRIIMTLIEIIIIIIVAIICIIVFTAQYYAPGLKLRRTFHPMCSTLVY